MRRFIRCLAATSAYSAVLERLIPRLEDLLYRWLERLEVRIVMYELRQGLSTARPRCKAMNRPRCVVDTAMDVGRPSVVVLGARLKADQRYCRTLIKRGMAIIRAILAARCGESRAKIKAP